MLVGAFNTYFELDLWELDFTTHFSLSFQIPPHIFFLIGSYVLPLCSSIGRIKFRGILQHHSCLPQHNLIFLFWLLVTPKGTCLSLALNWSLHCLV